MKRETTHILAALQAIFVTVLWSSSWVLIKIGLKEIPPITFAGIRYVLAFVCLVPVALFSQNTFEEIKRIRYPRVLQMVLLGIILYTVTQGAQFIALSLLPAVTVSLILSFTPILVAFIGIFILSEKLTYFQWTGLSFFLLGVFLYFFPIRVPAGEAVGLIVVGVGVLSNTFSSVLGRSINRRKDIQPLTVTFISMGFGSMALLAVGLVKEGIPQLNLTGWIIILWLAVVNTAFAFTLWNRTLRTLTAMESCIINNTMLFQIALLAWLFLGETLSGRKIIGMLVAGSGAVIVHLYRRRDCLSNF
ncbi:MAG: hypothetical protein AMS17_03850 [Spirochaetes bacterium DG_61]|jgi:drug/metabolite transporter (DMT)-like permease|nr:MAG: hypothetical protein AMS17_03850 [Spirochaetes bacterium DG_61]